MGLDSEKEYSTGNVVKSPFDERIYEYVKLDNKLGIVLIQDESTEKAAASMSVAVGQLQDPERVQGLAHFCEHMLFLGTEKYPDGDHFSKYLAEHGGSSNAYTSLEYTNFHFDVQQEYFFDALDIWVQFFISPLFNEDLTDKEMNAVHSEHEKNLNSDNWRLNQLDRNSSDPSHPYSYFGTGNLKTLKEIPEKDNIKVREHLLKFHQQYYSANIMTLCILCRGPLKDTKKRIVDLFNPVVNKNIELPSYVDPPFKAQHHKQLFQIIPVKDHYTLEINFSTFDSRPYYKKKPLKYFAHLIGHEGPGSILSYLKKKDWANSIMVGDAKFIRNVYGAFRIVFELTEEGTSHINSITECVFQYIQMLKQKGPQEFIHLECKHLGELSFRFLDKSSPISYVSNLSARMQHYDPEDLLCGPYYHYEYDEKLISESLDLLTPSNMRVFVFSPKAESCDKLGPWYGTKYSQTTISDDLISKWETASTVPYLNFPQHNDFIPSEFKYVGDDTKTDYDYPILVAESEKHCVWFKKDRTFKLNKIIAAVEIANPIIYETVKNSVMTKIYVELLKDDLNEITYNASLAGNNYSLGITVAGLLLNMHGYSHKFRSLLSCIVNRINSFKANETKFNIFKKIVCRSFKNYSKNQTYQHCMYHMHYLVSEKLWHHVDKIKAIDDITFEEFQEFIPKIFDGFATQSIIEGNATIEDARNILNAVLCIKKNAKSIKNGEDIDNIEGAAANKSPPKNNEYFLCDRHLSFKSGNAYVCRIKESVNTDSGIDCYVMVGQSDCKRNCTVQILETIIQERYYTKLRTNEQLGYIVHSTTMKISGYIGLRFIIQSTKMPEVLQDKTNEFLTSVKEIINSLTEEELAKRKEVLTRKKLEKFKNLSQEIQYHYNEVSNNQFLFNRKSIDVEKIKEISKQDLIDMYDTYIDPNSNQRTSISIWAYSINCDFPKEFTHTVGNKQAICIDEKDGIETFKKNKTFEERPHIHAFHRHLC